MAKKHTAFRLSPEALELCAKLAQKLGLTRTTVVEMSIRLLSESHGVQTDDSDNQSNSTQE